MADTADALDDGADWQRRVVSRSLRSARRRSITRGEALIRAATVLLERSGGDDFTVQDVADEASQSLRTLYQYFESKDDLLLAVFEEAMRTYAEMVTAAVAGLEDPLDRLAGAVLTVARLPNYSVAGVNGGLTRLRLRLTRVRPDLVGRSRAPIVSLLRDLVRDAVDAGHLTVTDPDAATYLVVSLNSASTTSNTLGNDVGVRTPAAEQLAAFCLRGLGAHPDAEWLAGVNARLLLPTRTFSPGGTARDPRRRQ